MRDTFTLCAYSDHFLFNCSSDKIMVKTSHDGAWQEWDYLEDRLREDPKKCLRSPLIRMDFRGIATAKKVEIMRRLVPLVRRQPGGEDKVAFWEDLPDDDIMAALQVADDSDSDCSDDDGAAQ